MGITTTTDCREEDGITVGLIDTIINAGHLLSNRALTSESVFEAISDLKSQSFLGGLFEMPQTEWRVVYRELSRQRLTGCRLFKVESEARAFIAGHTVDGVSLLFTWKGIRKEVGLQNRDFGSNGLWRVVEFERPKNSELKSAATDSDMYSHVVSR